MRRTLSATALAVATLLATACTPTTTPTPEPIPQPTLQCTPDTGGDPYPCDQATHDRMTARDAQYADAERIYRRSVELQYRLVEQRQPMNDELRSLLTGEFLDMTTTNLETQRTSNVSISGTLDVHWVHRDVNAQQEGSILTLHTCTGTGSLTVTNDGTVLPVTYFEELVFFTEVDGSLRIANNRIEAVEKC